MPYTVVEKVNPYIEYNPDDRDNIVRSIIGIYKDYDNKRANQKNQISNIRKILDAGDVIQSDNIESFESEFSKNKFENLFLKDASIKRILNTSIAHLYNSTFKIFNNIISIDLDPGHSDYDRANFSSMQKQSLIDIIDKSKPNPEFRKACHNWFAKGEIILKTTWTQRYKDIRRMASFDMMGISIPLNKYEYQKVLDYDGIQVKCIEPERFIYDEDKNIYIEENWMTIQQISNNQEFKKLLSDDKIKILKEKYRNKSKSSEDPSYKSGKVRVLEFEGDFELNRESSGEYEFCNNMKIVIVDDEHIAYFGYNPNIQCTYDICRYETDEETGRGIPLLACLMSNSIAITDTLNKLKIALALSIFKHHFVKAGVLTASKEGIKIRPGGITSIELEDGENLNNVITEVAMGDAIQIGQIMIEFLKGESEEMTQRFKLSSGDAPQKARTLGENKMIMQGQNVLFSYEFDKVIDLQINFVEKIGEFQSNFQNKSEKIRFKDNKGVEQTGIIDSKVRQANYIYTINESSTSMDKKMNLMEFIDNFMGKIVPVAQQFGYIPNFEKLLGMIASAYEQDGADELLTKMQPQGAINGQSTDTGIPVDPNASMAGNGEVLPPGNIQDVVPQ
jgi:hypothetical protein